MEGVTDYIAMFAEYLVMFINMIKEFFASFGGGATEEETE